MLTNTPYLESQIWRKDGRANISGYYNPHVESLFSKVSDVSPDIALLKKIQSLIQNDFPTVPLFYDETPVTYVKKLRALEDRMILMTMLSDIHTWYFESKAEILEFPFPEREREADTSLSGVG